RAGLERRRLGPGCRTEARADARQELLQRERLREVVIGAPLEAAHLGGDVVQGREHQDRLRWFALEQALEYGVSVDPGHHQIEDDEVVGAREREFEALLAVSR